MTRKPWLIYHVRFRICNPKANGCGFIIRLHKMRKMMITDPQQVSSGLQIPNSRWPESGT